MLYQTENPHGGDIYAAPVRLDFSANTNPFGTPEAILDAIRESLGQLHRYPDPYCRALVQAIAAFEGVPPEYILCGNGAAELIYAWCAAARPRRAVETAPTFAEYSLALERVGCRVERWTLREENAFALQEDFLAFLAAQQPEAVFLCNPNNPTGKLIDPALLEQIARYCHARHIRLFVDECFLDLTDGGQSLKGLLAEIPELFLLKAFTKSYGMAGVRLGYALSADAALLRAMSAAVQPWNVSTPAQAAGTAALGQQEFLQRTRDLVRTERAWLAEQLEALGCRVYPSQANFLLFHGPEDLHRKLREQGITIRSCSNYHGLGAGWYRIAVRLHHENEELIRAAAQCMGR